MLTKLIEFTAPEGSSKHSNHPASEPSSEPESGKSKDCDRLIELKKKRSLRYYVLVSHILSGWDHKIIFPRNRFYLWVV